MPQERFIPKNPVFDFLTKRKSDSPILWSQYICEALYNREFGYYRKDKKRTGGDGADFYTSESLRQNIFGRLLKYSIEKYFSDFGKSLEDFKLCHIGSEPGMETIPTEISMRLDDPKIIPPRAAIFSNELLDARPFDRFVFKGGRWNIEGIFIVKTRGGYIVKTELFNPPEEYSEILDKYFRKTMIEDFRVDISLDAISLFRQICSQNWKGIIIFFDYFRSAAQLCNFPSGTARTYFRHTSSNDILETPSGRDITYSPCSDIFLDILREFGFKKAIYESQESFFIERASEPIKEIIAASPLLDPRKRELVQLLNPSLMGIDFGAISACRF